MSPTTDIPVAQAPDDSAADADFVYEVDGVEYHSNRPNLTGAEIMAAAGIPPSEGLVRLLPDGTTASVAPTDTVHLVPDAQFKRRPRFKRG
jgi:hypothetical protein